MLVWPRARLRLRATAAGCLALVLVTGCNRTTRSIFFDGIASGPPPTTNKVRENLLRDNQQLQRQLAQTRKELEIAMATKVADEVERLSAEQAQNWSEVSSLLPKREQSGAIDWSQALDDGIIAPRSGVAPDAPAQSTLDLDVKLARTPGGVFAVDFQHKAHTKWLTCDSCHPRSSQ
ncbi:MAG: hypothetical protein OES26_24275 [Gammaproteobacteria bacterium]|nr:hypothetical protein [Gammaproteobacteria bacterium]